MLLVLGRPGSGCTTLLRMLANKREGYAEIEGDVHFGSMSPKEADQYQGQIVMNAEEEIFFPTLTASYQVIQPTFHANIAQGWSNYGLCHKNETACRGRK